MKTECKAELLKQPSTHTDLMTNINLCKTEGAEVVVCSSYCWFYGLPEEFLNKLANKRPHLFYSLKGNKRKKKEPTIIINIYIRHNFTALKKIFFKKFCTKFEAYKTDPHFITYMKIGSFYTQESFLQFSVCVFYTTAQSWSTGGGENHYEEFLSCTPELHMPSVLMLNVEGKGEEGYLNVKSLRKKWVRCIADVHAEGL